MSLPRSVRKLGRFNRALNGNESRWTSAQRKVYKRTVARRLRQSWKQEERRNR